MLRNVEHPGRPVPPLTPERRQRDAKADERDRLANQRDTEADRRDRLANQRDRELLQESATARLHAQLETMPVIEQAKGMIMEQNGCTAEEAFDLLRRASQRGLADSASLRVR